MFPKLLQLLKMKKLHDFQACIEIMLLDSFKFNLNTHNFLKITSLLLLISFKLLLTTSNYALQTDICGSACLKFPTALQSRYLQIISMKITLHLIFYETSNLCFSITWSDMKDWCTFKVHWCLYFQCSFKQDLY